MSMLKTDPEKVLIRLDWRRERAFRVGMLLARIGAILSLAATFVNFAFSTMAVVLADLLLCVGCLTTLYLTKKSGQNKLVWWPFYSAYWIAMTTTLYFSGGINSPFIGIFAALLFVGGVVIQSRVKAMAVLCFVLANFGFWLAADYWLPVTEFFVQPAIYTMLLNSICLSAVGICIHGFIKTESDLAEEFTARYHELRNAKDSLYREETANAAKSSFLANISHEFRTPLGVILGYVELLQSTRKEDSESQEFLSIIHRNGTQLAHLVDDLLDLSKAEADRLEVEDHEFNLHEVLHQVKDSLKLSAEKKSLRLEFRYANAIPERIATDSARLKQILLNLIGNALKFTAEGHITVLTEFIPGSSGEKDMLQLSVIDTGRGLSEEEKTKLFKPFSQADATMARKYGGTGLGLNLSKRLAELLGGDLVLAESTPGKGSCFKFTLSVDCAPNTAWVERFEKGENENQNLLRSRNPKEQDRFRLAGFNFLVVDDLVDNRVLVQRYIQGAGGNVEFANDGREGIQKALDGNFDMVLMDIQMPGLSGLDATTQLRERNYMRPIVALSAHAMEQDRDRSIAAGCNDHLTKPIRKEVFIDRIASLIEG